MNADEIVRALRDAEGNNELDCEISELRPLLLKAANLIESMQAQLDRETKSANRWVCAANDYRKEKERIEETNKALESDIYNNEIEKAIKHFEGLQKRYTTQHNGKHCKFVKTALAAFYEKQEREIGCEYCNNTDYIFESQQKIETPQWDEYEDGFIVIRQHINFCPMCGKRLEVEQDG